ncbi:Eci1 [Symbiodinium natans]|uniref:Eci1 protein n=1 Tax=Symbiodinium natans TaxID=878477 RepID=A0A812PEY4_9DINO|nr:Eci1 [Symbiodinium natans]
MALWILANGDRLGARGLGSLVLRALRVLVWMRLPIALALGGLLLRWLRRIQVTIRDSLALMNLPETDLDEELKHSLQATAACPPWGRGLPMAPRAGEWRQYLFGYKDAWENLSEIRGLLGVTRRKMTKLTLEQLAEGVRRVLLTKHRKLVQVTDRYWNQEQATTIAASLVAECGLNPEARGGLEECVEPGIGRLPFPTPGWIWRTQRWTLAAARHVFVDVWRWTPRFVATPYGQLHVYDAVPEGGSALPPLLLLHGMFVTGWSMALLAQLLHRGGRRILIPDLFDFDHGLSRSCTDGGRKVRRVTQALEAVMSVIHELLDVDQEFDIAGHSFGGYMVARIAVTCERQQLPLRKVVLLGPGGPVIDPHHSPMSVRFINAPLETAEELRPPWLPASVANFATLSALGVFLSPNNVNTLFGLDYDEYLGHLWLGTRRPTLLLWGDDDTVAKPRALHTLGPFLREKFPDLTAFWVKGGGHNIQFDSVLAVARAMRTFLDPEASAEEGLMEKMLWMTSAKLYPMDLSQTPGPRSQDATARL